MNGIKNIVLGIFVVFAGVFSFSLQISAQEYPLGGLSATYSLPNGFSYTVNAFEKDKPVSDADGEILYTEKEYSLVMPYGAKDTEIEITIAGAEAFYIGEKEYRSGGKYVLESGNHTVSCNGGEYYLNIFYTSDIPQIYMTLNDSIEYVNEDKNNETSGQITITDGITTEYDGPLDYIRGRGNMSWNQAKKPYNIKLAAKANLWGMGASKKYALIANQVDEAVIKSKSAIDFAASTGIEYCSESQFVDVYINNEYAGLYAITEKVDVEESRVNILDLDEVNRQLNPGVDFDSLANMGEAGPDGWKYCGGYKWVDIPNGMADGLGGGYLLEIEMGERYSTAKSGFVSEYGQPVVLGSPKYATKGQTEYIKEYYQQFEDAILGDGGYNADGIHYSEYIDVESMARMYVFQEFVQNLDASITSFYMYKDLNGKLAMCSAWDMDHSMGEDRIRNGYDLSRPDNIWVADNTQYWPLNHKKTVLTLLCQHTDFRREAVKQWEECFLPNIDRLHSDMKQLSESIYDSAVANNYKWLKPFYISREEAEQGYVNALAKTDRYMTLREEFISRYLSGDAKVVEYRRNGGSGVMIDKYSYMPGDAAIVLENEFTADGAQFIGWNTQPDGSGTAYQPGDTVQIKDSDVVLYAQWDNPPQVEAAADAPQNKAGFFASFIIWLKNLFN